MRYLTADYIFPVSTPPIRNGTLVADDDGIIVDVLSPGKDSPIEKTEYFRGILCPGFINAHCHLELSYLKGVISEKKGLHSFIGEIESVRRNYSEDLIQNALIEAENEMVENGIVGVGDICNSNVAFEQKAKGRIRYHTFIEALGFHPGKADQAFEKCRQLYHLASKHNLSSSITPHAPYSASLKLLEKISEFALRNNSILSIHNQENDDENKMFSGGKGEILEHIKKLGIDISEWKPTGKNSLQSIFPCLPEKNKILFVHNTYTKAEDISFIHSRLPAPGLPAGPEGSRLWFCFCPNANLYIENRLPDFKIFLDKNCKITVGTDSLASNNSLSILRELKTISINSPQIPLQELLLWATKNGAEFFGWEKNLGTFEKGKRPGINLLKNIDLKNTKLTKESEVQKIC